MHSKSKAALIAIASLFATAASQPRAGTAETYLIPLTSQAEVSEGSIPGTVGDKDGSGQVTLRIDMAKKEVCYDFSVANVATPLMAHIHRAPAPRNGPSVVTLFTGPGGELTNCLMWTEKWLAEIVADPSNFYVNLYTTEYPDGALRGQLAS